MATPIQTSNAATAMNATNHGTPRPTLSTRRWTSRGSHPKLVGLGWVPVASRDRIR
jgi:hypothetical protein